MINFDPNQLQPYFRLSDASFSLGAGATQVVAPADGQRVFLLFSIVNAAGAVYFRPVGSPSASVGIGLIQTSQLVIDFASWGTASQQQWQAFCASAVAIYALYVAYRPPGD